MTENIKEMCIQANHYLAPDMDKAMKEAHERETKPLAKQILGQLLENLEIAGEDMIPICQDTGMAVVFSKIGQDVHFEGGSVEEAVNEGVRQGYAEGYLRKICGRRSSASCEYKGQHSGYYSLRTGSGE